MSHYAESPQPTGSGLADDSYSGWVGWIVFAGMMMVLVGTFHVIQGLVALFKDEYYLVAPSGLVINMDYTAWGWVHIIVGAIAVFAGFGLFSGQMWARVVGTLVALGSAIVNVGFLAAYPIWSTLMIALNVVVIMALTVHGSDIRRSS